MIIWDESKEYRTFWWTKGKRKKLGSEFIFPAKKIKTSGRSVFATVSSPSTEETVNGRFWCIEQQSELFPAPISGREQYVTS
jgi:hypothetical protein